MAVSKQEIAAALGCTEADLDALTGGGKRDTTLKLIAAARQEHSRRVQQVAEALDKAEANATAGRSFDVPSVVDAYSAEQKQ